MVQLGYSDRTDAVTQFGYKFRIKSYYIRNIFLHLLIKTNITQRNDSGLTMVCLFDLLIFIKQLDLLPHPLLHTDENPLFSSSDPGWTEELLLKIKHNIDLIEKYEPYQNLNNFALLNTEGHLAKVAALRNMFLIKYPEIIISPDRRTIFCHREKETESKLKRVIHESKSSSLENLPLAWKCFMLLAEAVYKIPTLNTGIKNSRRSSLDTALRNVPLVKYDLYDFCNNGALQRATPVVEHIGSYGPEDCISLDDLQKYAGNTSLNVIFEMTDSMNPNITTQVVELQDI